MIFIGASLGFEATKCTQETSDFETALTLFLLLLTLFNVEIKILAIIQK